MSKSYRVAVAFSEEEVSDVRFGQAEKVQIYDLTPNEIIFREVRYLPDKTEKAEGKCSGCHGKDDEFLNAVGELLFDCNFLVIEEIGGYPTRVFLRYGIQVLEQGGSIKEILNKLNQFLRR